jgi:hypothetical protein
MDMNIHKTFLTLSLTFLSGVLSDFDSSLTLSGEVKKNCFLSFHSPPKLRFHEVPATADRLNLLTLGDPVSKTVDEVILEDNESIEVSEFPLTSYGDDEKDLTVDDQPTNQDILPPADPFADYELGSSGVDSTDQLIQLFENLEKTGNSSSRVSVNFIPPYSTDSGNFKIESRASYTRRVRQ